MDAAAPPGLHPGNAFYVMAVLVTAIHAPGLLTRGHALRWHKERRGCPAQGRAWRRRSVLHGAGSRGPRALRPGDAGARQRSGFARRLAHAAVAVDAGGEHVLGRALPPILGREDLDLAEPGIAGGLDPAADAAQIDDAVAHHAAVVEQVARRHQPVAEVEGEEAAGRAGAGDLAAQIRVPPDMVDVDCDA